MRINSLNLQKTSFYAFSYHALAGVVPRNNDRSQNNKHTIFIHKANLPEQIYCFFSPPPTSLLLSLLFRRRPNGTPQGLGKLIGISIPGNAYCAHQRRAPRRGFAYFPGVYRLNSNI